MADETPGAAADSSPEAGWYPDPKGKGSRYWDGERWTEFTGPRSGSMPDSPPGAAGAPAVVRVETPRRLGSIAWAAYAVLGFALLVNLVYVPIAIEYSDAIQTRIDGSSLSLDEAYDAEDALGIVSIAYVVAGIAGAIGFLVWFHRAYSNLPGITGQPLRFGAGWSIGAWFIPIFNLWRPKQIANDVWRGGDPAARGNPAWAALRVSPLVHWWWAFYLLGGIVGGIGGGMLSVDPVLSDSVAFEQGRPTVGDAPPTMSELESERAAGIVLAVSGALEAIAAIAAIYFVKQASERQDKAITGLGAPQTGA